MAYQKIDRKAYEYFVINPGRKILSGWEFRDDAQEFIDNQSKTGLKIYTRSYLKRNGMDPSDNNNWYHGLGKLKNYSTQKEIVLSGDFRKNIQIPEIKIRYNKGKSFGKIKNSSDVYEFLKRIYGRQINLQEHFVLLLADNSLNIIGYYKHTVGTPASTLADIPMLMSIVLKSMARSFIISHNHPSGNNRPSEADRQLTKKIRKAADDLNLNMLDHVIVTEKNGYYSFADEGLSGVSSYYKRLKNNPKIQETILKVKEKSEGNSLKWAAILGLVGIVGYATYKLLGKSDAEKKREETDNDVVDQPITQSNLSMSQSDLLLVMQNIFNAMNRYGTDEETIINNLSNLTRDDILFIINAFGYRLYASGVEATTWIDREFLSTNLNLIGWLKSELSGSDLATVKSIFDFHQIPF